MRTLLRLIVVLMALVGMTAGAVVALAPAADELTESQTSTAKVVDLDRLDDYDVRSYVYAADGGLLATLHAEQNREPVTLDRVPAPVIQAIIAVEDADFYRHKGVNLRALVRATLENVSEGGVVQGGSTITQQLVKNTYLTSDQQIGRKADEIPLALAVERELSKDEILLAYLNSVYFGAGAYGVLAAAETYWGKPVEQLGWAEAAMLAALIRNPNEYNPFLNPDLASKQRRIALERVVAEGLLTRDEARELANAPIPVSPCGADSGSAGCRDTLTLPPPEDYFVEDVKQQLLNDPSYGLGPTSEERTRALFTGGLRIFTTLDPGAQFAAEAAVAKVVPANDQGVTAATITIENQTGAVRAVVGGPGFDSFKYNVATHEPGRQTGSTFKVFVLLAALEMGAVPSDTTEGGGSFPNPGGVPDPYKINGKGGSLESVTLASSNGAFVRLAKNIGMQRAFDVARRLGVTEPDGDPWLPVLSAPLGTYQQTPLEMASAFSAIPNGGLREPPYFVERIEDRTGRIIYEHKPQTTRPLSAQTACLAAKILEGNVKSGTGTRARLRRQPAAGKTGTTGTNDDNTGNKTYDVWFVGFTPYATTAVWMGNPLGGVDMRRFGGVTNFGGVYPARIWSTFNEAYHSNLEVTSFPSCKKTRSGRNITERGISGAPISGSSPSTTVPGGSTTTTRPSATTTTAPDPTTTGTTVEPPPTTEPPPSTTEPPPTTTTPPTTAPPPGGG